MRPNIVGKGLSEAITFKASCEILRPKRLRMTGWLKDRYPSRSF
jgi:hypothetical protein